MNPLFYELDTFVERHEAAIRAESGEEEVIIKQFNLRENQKGHQSYKGHVISETTSKGLQIIVDIDENHEIFPGIGEICQIQLERGPFRNKQNSAPRFAERVEYVQALQPHKKKYAEFHVAPTPSNHWIDEKDSDTDEGKMLARVRPAPHDLLD